MIQNKEGVIISISSIAVSKNGEYIGAYSASKAAPHSITMTAAKELSPLGDNFTTIEDNIYSHWIN
jgi:NAD(P)-dependent dehydrogenase (short-subunit alcohol dehydrogenase family)